MTTAQILGLILAVWGAAGMWVAGKGRWAGWAMGLAVQPVWVAFALVVHSWPLVLSPVLYGTVYARNLWKWWHRPKGIVIPRSEHQLVHTPPAVRRARAPKRKAAKAHRQGVKNFRR